MVEYVDDAIPGMAAKIIAALAHVPGEQYGKRMSQPAGFL